jgi:hypothetical protein
MHAKVKAVALRKQGYSYTEIAKRTGLSKSTLSYHLSHIPYVPNPKMVQKVGAARIAAARTHRKKKLATLSAAASKANTMIGSPSKRDILMLGIGLYIGEGSKTNDIVRLVNADADVLRLYLTWLFQLGVQVENIRLRLHIYPSVNKAEAEYFWLQSLALPESCLQRTLIDTRVNKVAKRQGAKPFGTAHVTVIANGNQVLGVRFARLIGALSKKVLE